MNVSNQILTLDRPAHYQIKVPGQFTTGWAEWAGRISHTLESDDNGRPITVLTGKLDQAALQGLLRHLYGLGLPLISVICLDCDQ